jgi:large subunit ribosomal protein L32
MFLGMFKVKGGVTMSICPKNKHSKARRDKHRAHWKMSVPNMVKCSKCGELMLSHRVCKSCGSYNKKEVIAQD